MINRAYVQGCRAALAKFALEAPNAVEQFVAEVEHAKDVAPTPAAALDGTTPLQLPPGA